MKVFIFGTQRIWNIFEKIDIIDITNSNYKIYSNNIDQYIQELNQVLQKINIPIENFNLMFQKDILKSLNNNSDKVFKDLLVAYNKADYIIVDMQSLKYFKKDNYYYDVSLFSKNSTESSSSNIGDGSVHSKEEFILLLRTFANLVRNKKIFFVGTLYHDSANLKKINQRMIINNIVNKFVDNNKTYFINPSTVFDLYDWTYIMKDSNHCTEEGELIVQEYIRAEMEYLDENINQENQENQENN